MLKLISDHQIIKFEKKFCWMHAGIILNWILIRAYRMLKNYYRWSGYLSSGTVCAVKIGHASYPALPWFRYEISIWDHCDVTHVNGGLYFRWITCRLVTTVYYMNCQVYPSQYSAIRLYNYGAALSEELISGSDVQFCFVMFLQSWLMDDWYTRDKCWEMI